MKTYKYDVAEVFDNCPDAILLIIGNEFTYCNPATAKMLLMDEPKQVLNTHPSLISPKYQPDGQESYQKANLMIDTAYSKGFHSFTWNHMKTNGKTFLVQVSLTVIDYQGQRGLLAIWKDLTVSQELNIYFSEFNKLKERLFTETIYERKLSLIAKGVKDIFGMCVCKIWALENADNCNKGCYHSKQCKLRSKCLHLKAISDREYLCESDIRVPLCSTSVGKVALSKMNKFYEELTPHKDWFIDYNWSNIKEIIKSYGAFRLRFSTDKTSGVMLFCSNRTYSEFELSLIEDLATTASHIFSLKEVEQAAIRNEAKLKAVYDTSSDAIMLLNEKGFIDCNLATLKLFNVDSVESFKKLHPGDISPPEQPDGESSHVKANRLIQAAYKHGSNRFDWIHCSTDKINFPAEVLLTVFDYMGDKILQATVRDISERKMFIRELEAARKSAESANQAKSEFLAKMSHEIRTPMNAVTGLTYLLLQEDINSKQRNYLKKIELSAKNLLGIINDILDFSKIEAGKLDIDPIDFEIESLFDNVASIVAVKLQEKADVEFAYDIDCKIPELLIGDPLRLGQILINLVNNSVKFTDRGEVVITVKLDKSFEDRVVLKFCIRDTGIGMTEEQIQKLFKAFSQAETGTTRKYGGTGLGLYISKQLVELMGGEIEVKSEYGVGSEFRFRIEFPISKKQVKNHPLPADIVPNLKALIVDDSSTSRKILRNILTSFNISSTEAKSGEDALDLIKKAIKDKAPFKLTFVDWQMPGGIDGIETIIRIQKEIPIESQPKTVLLTAYENQEIVKSAENIGVDIFLAKPIGSSIINDSIMELFANEINIEKPDNTKSSTKNFDFTGIKILLVEDNKINQEIAAAFLENTKAAVDIVDNGAAAVEKVINDDMYSLILMDIQMPEMDGNEATKYLRQKGIVKTPIIAMSANAITDEMESSLKTGMNDYITKPINPKLFYKTLSRWIPERDDFKRNSAKSSEDKVEETTFESERMSSLPVINGINIENGIALTGGKLELYNKLLENYFFEFMDSEVKIKNYAESLDFSKARLVVHTLKGLSANLGAEQLADVLTLMEKALIEEDQEVFLSIFMKFQVKFKVVFDALGKLFLNKTRGSSCTENIKINDNISSSQFSQNLSKLQYDIKTGNLKKIKEKIKEIETTGIPSLQKESFLHLKTLAEKYKFKEANICLEDIISEK